jgi:hypothetical protein
MEDTGYLVEYLISATTQSTSVAPTEIALLMLSGSLQLVQQQSSTADLVRYVAFVGGISNVVQPCATASMMHESPRPPQPKIATVSLAWSCPCCKTAQYAVEKRHPRAAACTNKTASGILARLRSARGSARYSAKPPYCKKPGCFLWRQTVDRSQLKNRPQLKIKGTATQSPLRNMETPVPVPVTTPPIS